MSHCAKVMTTSNIEEAKRFDTMKQVKAFAKYWRHDRLDGLEIIKVDKCKQPSTPKLCNCTSERKVWCDNNCIGKCNSCGAIQLLSYGTCNYNGVCKGRVERQNVFEPVKTN